MNKEKFEAKCQELVDYEEKVLLKAQQIVHNKNEVLDNLGLKCCAFLNWNFFGTEKFYNCRPDFKELYTCQLFIIICAKEDNPQDDSLEAISLIYTITVLNKGFFIPNYKFRKICTPNFEYDFYELYKEVLEIGYDETLKKHYPQYKLFKQ